MLSWLTYATHQPTNQPTNETIGLPLICASRWASVKISQSFSVWFRLKNRNMAYFSKKNCWRQMKSILSSFICWKIALYSNTSLYYIPRISRYLKSSNFSSISISGYMPWKRTNLESPFLLKPLFLFLPERSVVSGNHKKRPTGNRINPSSKDWTISIVSSAHVWYPQLSIVSMNSPSSATTHTSITLE